MKILDKMTDDFKIGRFNRPIRFQLRYEIRPAGKASLKIFFYA
jgi:hypothetical protein